ncbi:MAG: tRNA 4-thiouridine(8) synthase ThiI [Bacillota bacterium]|nr:tRNA 4-thiouridine(8) synthase ThiI [Bacillota bacterium]
MKAISLFSGGLDSQLAVCLMKEQGIEIIGINFTTPFFGAEESTIKAAKDLDIELTTIHLGEEYLKVLKNPVYGYGKNMNPCIDCHAFMQKKAVQYMKEIGASFLISGEVVGQRPMSQTFSSLNAVDKLAGIKGIMVRPLSAKLLTPTIAEENGWIDRDKMLDISGRTRNWQMELAEHYGLKDYPTPAGGCLLTQQNYSKRLKTYLEAFPMAAANDLYILRYGRHFYLEENLLLMIGRNQAENQALVKNARSGDLFMKILDRPGPTSIVRTRQDLSEDDLIKAAQITARYGDTQDCDSVNVKVYKNKEDIINILKVTPLKPNETPQPI